MITSIIFYVWIQYFHLTSNHIWQQYLIKIYIITKENLLHIVKSHVTTIIIFYVLIQKSHLFYRISHVIKNSYSQLYNNTSILVAHLWITYDYKHNLLCLNTKILVILLYNHMWCTSFINMWLEYVINTYIW